MNISRGMKRLRLKKTEYKEYFEEDVKTDIKERIKLLNIFCDICLKVFKTKSALTNHIQSVHKEVKYPCDQCGKQFTKKGNLKTHIQSLHERVKYPCDQCGKQFTQQGER